MPGAPLIGGSRPSVSVVIATACRRPEIRRAIASVLSQDVPVELIVVANGPRYDPALAAEIGNRTDLRFCHLPEGDMAKAQEHGRGLVTADCFSFLDDDDVYLPGGLQLRLRAFAQDPALDFVVTNGYSTAGALVARDGDAINRDPLRALLHGNWLASAAALYRTERIGREVFIGLIKYYEWTHLAFRLVASGKRLSFVDVPTYQLYDTPGSLSKEASEVFYLASLRIIEYMMSAAPSGILDELLPRRRNEAMHDLSNYYLSHGEMRKAWKYHLHGWKRHLLYTRKLIFSSKVPGHWRNETADD